MREVPCFVALVLVLSGFHVSAWSTTPGVALRAGRFCPGRCMSQAATPVPAAHASGTPRRRLIPTCKLDRLPARTLKRVVPLRPTTDKYLAFFGQTPIDRRRKMINLLGGLFAGYWIAFFASRNVYVLGPGGVSAIAWRGSCLAVFVQTFVRPVLGSYNRALELWGAGSKGGRRKTKGALFTGRVTRTGFALSPQASKHRTHFQMLVEDESGRELLFDVPSMPEYRQVRTGMRCAVVVLSRSSAFSELTGVTEAYLPELDLFVGRFPALDKRVFWDLLRERKKRRDGSGGGGGGGTVIARRKADSLSGGRGGGSERFDSNRSRGSSTRTGSRQLQLRQQQQQQRSLAGESMARDGKSRGTGGLVARSPRSTY